MSLIPLNIVFDMLKKSSFCKISLVLFYLCTITVVKASAIIDGSIDAELLIEGLPKSWSITVSPKNDLFLTDHSGGIILLDENWQKQRYSTSIIDLFTDGQGGFLDITFHPDYLTNDWIYLSYSAGNSDSNRLKVVRFALPVEGNEITQIEHVFTVLSNKNTPVHYGGRLAFLPDNTLLISTGDGFDFREQAQLKSSHL